MSAEKKSTPISSRHKALLIGVALAGLIGLSVLALLWPRTSCEGIFEQTTPKVEAHLEIIKNKGAFAIAHEKIQEVSESAQKVALHLETCCSVFDGGKLDPEQFQQCIDKASAYDRQIALIAQEVTEVTEAKEKGVAPLQECNGNKTLLRVAAMLDHLALLACVQRKYDLSEHFFKRSLAISETVRGPDHLDVANTLKHLSGVYFAQRKHDLALRCFKRSDAIFEKAMEGRKGEKAGEV